MNKTLNKNNVKNLLENLNIDNSKIVTVTKMNHIVEVQYMQKRNNKNNILKLNSDEYLVLDTQEIKQFKKTTKRSDSKNSLYQTFKRLRYLINNNFTGARNELFVTLTYADNMTDKDILYKDVDKFLKRLRYKYNAITSIDYINVVEPQNRGAWHCHILLRFNDLEEVFISNEDMFELWGHGFVTVKAIDKVDNVGAYLTAYLTDISLDDYLDINNSEFNHEVKNVNNKKFVKGGRLSLYPPGMKIYRSSRGIKKPDRFDVPFEYIKKYVSSEQLTYSREISIETDDFTNQIIYLHYNLKR